MGICLAVALSIYAILAFVFFSWVTDRTPTYIRIKTLLEVVRLGRWYRLKFTDIYKSMTPVLVISNREMLEEMEKFVILDDLGGAFRLSSYHTFIVGHSIVFEFAYRWESEVLHDFPIEANIRCTIYDGLDRSLLPVDGLRKALSTPGSRVYQLLEKQVRFDVDTSAY